MAMTPQQINAAFFSAFGRNATQAELSYWATKSQTTLKEKLIATPSAKGAYDTPAKKAARGEGGTPPSVGDQLPPGPLKAIYDETKALLDELKRRGQVINPNIEITPEKTAEFMKQAEGEINPYYQTHLKLAREGFLSSVGYDAESLRRFEQDLEKKYTTGFRQIGEQAAEQGFAQSGLRQRDETQFDQGVQRQIEDTRRELTNRSTELARAFGQQYGGQELKGFAAPTIGGLPEVSGGKFVGGGGQQGVYSLSPDIYDQLVGTQEFERRAATQSRASELESAFRTAEAAKQARSLYI